MQPGTPSPDSPQSAVSPLNAVQGEDGDGIRATVEPYLNYLSGLAKELGVVDPVAAYFDPLVGQWSELHTEANRWREAAKVAGQAAVDLGKPLGEIDARWEGKDADAFVGYIHNINNASQAAQDAFAAIAQALDEVASALRQIVKDLADLLADAADVTSESATLPEGGEGRAKDQLADASQSAKDMFDAARDVLESFAALCDQVQDGDPATAGIDMAHRYPCEKFAFDSEALMTDSPANESLDTTMPASASTSELLDDAQLTQPANEDGLEEGHSTASGPIDEVVPGKSAADQLTPSASAPTSATPAVGGMLPLGMLPLGAAPAQGGDAERQTPKRHPIDPTELFGEPERSTPPVIGRD